MIKRKPNYLVSSYFSVFSSDITTPVSESTKLILVYYRILKSPSLKYTHYTQLSSDNISPIVYKCCALSLLKPICHLFAVSQSSGNIPSQWCTHWITPIYKSGDKSFVSNYQSISLLCILSKVLERVVYNNILRYSECSFLCHQFDFLQGRPAIQQLLLFTERFLEAKSMRAEADVIHTIKNQITAYLWNHFTTSFNSDSLSSYHVICPCYRCSRQPVSVNFFRLTDTSSQSVLFST